MAVEALRRGNHVVSVVPAGFSLKRVGAAAGSREDHGLEIHDGRGEFDNIFYREVEHRYTSHAVYAYGASCDCQSCAFIQSIDTVKRENIDISKVVPTWSWGYLPMLYQTHYAGMIILNDRRAVRRSDGLRPGRRTRNAEAQYLG